MDWTYHVIFAYKLKNLNPGREKRGDIHLFFFSSVISAKITEMFPAFHLGNIVWEKEDLIKFPGCLEDGLDLKEKKNT